MYLLLSNAALSVTLRLFYFGSYLNNVILYCLYFFLFKNPTPQQEGTSSELEENDSAIERSYSPTPERVTADDLITNNNNINNNKRVAPGFAGLSEASSSLAVSKSSIYNFFSSRTNLFVKDDDGSSPFL
jgi:hypothetical protein